MTLTPEMMLGVSGTVIALLVTTLGVLIKWIIGRLTQELSSTRQAMHELRESVNHWKLDVVDRMARIETRAQIEEQRK